ncbi:MAG: HAMP domain-containing sensor histidine kinase [Bacteroidota bacterium]|nr:HAMP domain-containing sensor histidine kinase [Bacteroidota bacterium]
MVLSLLVILSITWGLRSWRVATVHSDVSQRQEAAVNAAAEQIRANFEGLQHSMLALAADVAGDLLVAEVLGSSDTVPSETLLRSLDALDLPPRHAIACFTSQMDLIAWKGVSIPGSAQVTQIPAQVHWATAQDGGWRDALVVWHPVFDGGRQVGAVRLTQLLFERLPVQNESLRNYSVTDDWARRVELPVSLILGAAADSTFALSSLRGDTLAGLTILPPTAAGLIEVASKPYDSLAALWLTLLTLWVVLVLWKRHGNHASTPRLLMLSAAVIGGRYLLLELDVPARFQTGKAPLSPLFDPVHHASTLGEGLMRSSGDFLLSALCLLVLAVAVTRHAMRRRPSPVQSFTYTTAWSIRMTAAALATVALTCVLAAAVHASVFDSTLDYVTRSDLLPVPLEFVVFGALAIASLATLLLAAGMVRLASGSGRLRLTWYIVTPVLAASMVMALATEQQWCPWYVSAAYLVAGAWLARRLTSEQSADWLSVRQVLLAVLMVSLLVYPLFYRGISQRKQEQVAYAAASFETGDEPGISFAVREVVEEALRRNELPALLEADAELDSMAASLLQGTLLASLTSYDASVAFLNAGGGLLHVSGQGADSAGIMELFGQMRPEQGLLESTYNFIEPLMPGTHRHQYAGMSNIGVPVRGWILVQARPHIVLEEANTPLLRTLLSSGYRHLYTGLSLASFRDGLLVRSVGRSFERYELDAQAAAALQASPEIWRTEQIRGRTYDTYYHQINGQVVAARLRVIGLTDHLYYLLRLMSGGFLAGILVILVGLVWRWRAGQLPASRVYFRDRVLNAFILVGVLAVIPVGIGGVGVITEENEKAVQSWLRQHLQRVEETLESEARPGESSLNVLSRISIDALAARSGLDLNLYRGASLIAASRPQLITDRIIDTRLPASVYRALYFDADRFTFVDHRLGDFTYTAGYRAILDEAGRPRYVLSVPALPEAERIEEERARTLAYLFGALLALGMIVLAIASLLARTLARPIARLQRGLQGVAEGRYEQMVPVRTRDEVGDLVRTFNAMQEQLTESRQKLGQQERQLAWREMARQVAHEIKNPLTPMKLSVQHLRQAAESSDRSEPLFRALFERVTRTLVDQIDSLAHIANEFASLAQLPLPDVKRLDLIKVIREAHALMREDTPPHVRWVVNLPDGNCPVRADRKALRRIFINLIKNALEALQDTAEGTIRIDLELQDRTVTATVTDTGPGIPPELHPRIFEPSFSTKTSGAGLGLAIARQSAETMGGSMDFESVPGRGTTMRVNLPLFAN